MIRRQGHAGDKWDMFSDATNAGARVAAEIMSEDKDAIMI